MHIKTYIQKGNNTGPRKVNKENKLNQMGANKILLCPQGSMVEGTVPPVTRHTVLIRLRIRIPRRL